MWIGVLATAFAAEYDVRDIGTLGGRSAAAAAINERGQVVGIAGTAGTEQHAFLWENGEMRDLGTLGGRHSFAWDINEAGQVVGGAQDARGKTRAVKWEGGKARDLGTLEGGEASFALAINGRGQVVGFSQAGDGTTHAVLWEAAGQIVDLGTLGGGFAYAVDINERGEVLGMSTTPSGHRAFLWREGEKFEVGPKDAAWSSGLDLNDAGQVVGSAPVGSADALLGYRWSPDGTVETFGLGGDIVIVAAVNASGHAAGYGTLANGSGSAIEASAGAELPGMPTELVSAEDAPPVAVHAFVYRDGAVIDLGTLGGAHASAVDINVKGHVVGASARADGVPRAYVWADGAMGELDTPPDASAGATDINDRGEVVGSWAVEGRRRAFLAVPCQPGAPCGSRSSRPPSTE